MVSPASACAVACAVALSVVAGCARDSLVQCGDLLCPVDTACSPEHHVMCVSSEQIDGCGGLVDGSACTYGADATAGLCFDGACVAGLATCGDGFVDGMLGETCDCGSMDLRTAPPADIQHCNGFNSDEPGATCRPGCMRSACGDGVLDPGEACDDGNRVSGDGCSADCLGRFAKMQTPTAVDLYGTWTSGPNDAWAVGGTTVLHYDGTSWAMIDLGPDIQWDVVWGTGPNDVWFAGSTGSAGNVMPRLSHCTSQCTVAASWTPVDIGFFVESLWGTGPSDVYVVGHTASFGDQLCHYDGSSCSAETNFGSGGYCIGSTDDLQSLWGADGTHVYAIGMASGLCALQSNNTWRQIGTPFATQIVGHGQSLYMLDGQAQRLYISSLASPATTATVVIPGMPSWLVAPGPSSLPTFIAHPGDDEVLAIGSGGLVLDYDVTANSWLHLVLPTEADLSDISASSATNVFIVGQRGTILH